MPESGEKSQSEGGSPAATSSEPIAAIWAPLSVQKRSGGMRTWTPAASARSVNRARRREFAEKPPPTTMVSQPVSSAARTALAVRESLTASEKAAQTFSLLTVSPRLVAPSM